MTSHTHRWVFVLPCALSLLACASTSQRRATDGYFDPYVVTLDLDAANQRNTALQVRPT